MHRPRTLAFLHPACGALAFALLGSWAQTAYAEEVTITEKARAHFRVGVNLLQDPDGARYAEAYAEFKQAYAESPSWKILGNLGISAMKLERDGEAIEAFEKYLAESGDQIEASERAQVSRDLETLKAGVTWVTLSSTPVGASVVDVRVPVTGSQVENRYDPMNEPLRIGVRRGRHRITVELDGYEPGSWTFDAAGGELTHAFELVEKKTAGPSAPGGGDTPKTYERPVPASVFIGLAATGVFTVGATVTGILALDKKSGFTAQNGVDQEAAEGLKSDGETMNLMTDIFIGGAILAAGTTAYLYFTRPEVEADPTKDIAIERRFRVEPTVLPGGGGVWMRGTF